MKTIVNTQWIEDSEALAEILKEEAETNFSRLCKLPLSEQVKWRDWRHDRLKVTPRDVIVAQQSCPLHVCRAAKGATCRTASGTPTYHGSRENEYFARLYLESESEVQ